MPLHTHGNGQRRVAKSKTGRTARGSRTIMGNRGLGRVTKTSRTIRTPGTRRKT